MEFPDNTLLPFFAYGIFKPGDLGFLRFKGLVESIQNYCKVSGHLLIRDGLPLLQKDDKSNIMGSLINFKPECSGKAYFRIIELEPDKHYKWDKIEVITDGSKKVEANVLVGLYPDKGSTKYEGSLWNGKEDPFFNEALEVINEVIVSNDTFNFDFKKLFRLQMAYLLLWSSIERYASLRYHFGKEAMEKVKNIGKESAFAEGLNKFVSRERIGIKVYRTDDPSEYETLNPNNPKKALQFYYQIRSNITHRGKTANRDFKLLQLSLEELTEIFKIVLQAAFEEAKQYENNL